MTLTGSVFMSSLHDGPNESSETQRDAAMRQDLHRKSKSSPGARKCPVLVTTPKKPPLPLLPLRFQVYGFALNNLRKYQVNVGLDPGTSVLLLPQLVFAGCCFATSG